MANKSTIKASTAAKSANIQELPTGLEQHPTGKPYGEPVVVVTPLYIVRVQGMEREDGTKYGNISITEIATARKVSIPAATWKNHKTGQPFNPIGIFLEAIHGMTKEQIATLSVSV